jgi:hypothetical protein
VHKLTLTAGGKILCLRCQALSKRTHVQCGAPATKGKQVCRFHGGKSTGPKTKEGRERCAKAKTIHGMSTRQAKRELSLELQEIYLLHMLAWHIGMLESPRPTGRPPYARGETALTNPTDSTDY